MRGSTSSRFYPSQEQRFIPHDRASNPMGANDPHLDVNTMKKSNREAGVTHAV